jgi:hypothetical protein
MPDFGGLLSRIGSGIRSGINTAEDHLMPEPKGLEGLLSPEDIATARRQGMMNLGFSLLGDQSPHFGEALAHGLQSAQGGYGNAVNQTVQTQMVGQDVRQKMNILKARQQIAQQFPPRQGESPAQTIDRMKGMFAAYLNAGDLESAGKLGEVLKSIGKDAAGPALQHVDAGNKILVVDPHTGQTIREIPKGPAPKDPNAPVAAADHYRAEQTNKILDDFRTESADFRKASSGYEVLKGALAHPGLAQPFAVLDAYARVVNPGAVVRQGTMQVLQEMGSYDQKMRRWLDMAQKGQWPPDMLQSIKATIDGIMDEHRSTYREMRKRALERGRRSGVDLDALIDNPESSTSTATAPTAATGASSRVSRFMKPGAN